MHLDKSWKNSSKLVAINLNHFLANGALKINSDLSEWTFLLQNDYFDPKRTQKYFGNCMYLDADHTSNFI